jgi:hypothetical protein
MAAIAPKGPISEAIWEEMAPAAIPDEAVQARQLPTSTLEIADNHD